MTIAILNESTVLTDDQVSAWVPALQTQITEHFGPIWGMATDLSFVSKADAASAADDWQMIVLDNSDQAGALGYHDVTAAGLPLGKVFAATDQQNGSSVSVTLSHELLEMLGDPSINSAYTLTDANGNITTLLAYEACDAVEDDSYGYEIDGVLVSDFIFPSWFGGIEATKFDYQGHCTSTGQILSGGYTAAWTPSGGWTQVNGQLAQEKAEQSRAPEGSRRERRMRGSKNWKRSLPEDQRASLR